MNDQLKQLLVESLFDPGKPVLYERLGRLIQALDSLGGPVLKTNGTPNANQAILNVIAGTNMTITDNGLGGVTFNATGSGGGISYGGPVTGGHDNEVLYIDASGNLASSPNVTYDGTDLQVNDGSNVLSLTTGNRRLVDSFGVTALEWSTRHAIDGLGNILIDWNGGILYDAAGQPSVDWVNRILRDASGTAIFEYGIGITLPELAGMGNGIVGIDNAGLLSWASPGLSTVSVTAPITGDGTFGNPLVIHSQVGRVPFYDLSTGDLTDANRFRLTPQGLINTDVSGGNSFWGDAGNASVSGGGNVIVGSGNVAMNLSSGNSNVGVGNAIFTNLTSGSNNTALGSAHAGTLTTEQFNIFIGINNDIAPGISNSILLGNNINGIAVNSNTFYVGNGGATIISHWLMGNQIYEMPTNGFDGFLLNTSGSWSWAGISHDGTLSGDGVGTPLSVNSATPSLTATEIAFGDVSNQMTSSANLSYAGTTLTQLANSGNFTHLLANGNTTVTDKYENTSSGGNAAVGIRWYNDGGLKAQMLQLSSTNGLGNNKFVWDGVTAPIMITSRTGDVSLGIVDVFDSNARFTLFNNGNIAVNSAAQPVDNGFGFDVQDTFHTQGQNTLTDLATGGAAQFVTADTNGVLGITSTIPSSSVSLTTNQIAFGYGSNLMTSNANFTYNITDDRFSFASTINNDHGIFYNGTGAPNGLNNHRGIGMDFFGVEVYTFGQSGGVGNGTHLEIDNGLNTITLTDNVSSAGIYFAGVNSTGLIGTEIGLSIDTLNDRYQFGNPSSTSWIQVSGGIGAFGDIAGNLHNTLIQVDDNNSLVSIRGAIGNEGIFFASATSLGLTGIEIGLGVDIINDTYRLGNAASAGMSITPIGITIATVNGFISLFAQGGNNLALATDTLGFTLDEGNSKFVFNGGNIIKIGLNNIDYSAANAAGFWKNDGSGLISYTNNTQLPHSIFTPTTGSTVNLVNNQYNAINPAGALLALTLNFPAFPADNDVVEIKFDKGVTTVTYSGGTILGGITTAVLGDYVKFTYDAGTSTWY